MRAVGPVALTSLWSWSAGWLRLPGDDDLKPWVLNRSDGAFVLGNIVVPWQALAVYATMEALSIGLVWVGTRLIERRLPEMDNKPATENEATAQP